MPPLSLPMLKMEKNFIAHIEKKYPRKPYEIYPLEDLIAFVGRELKELEESIETLDATIYHEMGYKLVSERILDSMWEVADVSNTLDYLFEKLIKTYTELKDEIK